MKFASASQSGIMSLASECTLYTKLISVFLCGFYGLSFLSDSEKFLAITPGYLFPPNAWVWTLLTFSFFNTSIFFVISDICTVFLIEKLVLPLWGWIELLKFCALINGLSALMSSFTFLAMYFATFDVPSLFHTHINGLIPLLASLTVVGRQMMPDNVLLTLPLVICLKIAGIISTVIITSTCYGILFSWIYLRFYQKHSNGNKGDMGDTFTFAKFFPNHLEPPVAILANTVFSLLVKVKVCKKTDRHYDISSPTTIALTITSGDPQDAERRKQLAMKALNDRLQKADRTQTAAWPSLDDAEPSPPTPVQPPSPPPPPSLPPAFVEASKSVVSDSETKSPPIQKEAVHLPMETEDKTQT